MIERWKEANKERKKDIQEGRMEGRKDRQKERWKDKKKQEHIKVPFIFLITVSRLDFLLISTCDLWTSTPRTLSDVSHAILPSSLFLLSEATDQKQEFFQFTSYIFQHFYDNVLGWGWLEPESSWSAVKCSTTDLLPQYIYYCVSILISYFPAFPCTSFTSSLGVCDFQIVFRISPDIPCTSGSLISLLKEKREEELSRERRRKRDTKKEGWRSRDDIAGLQTLVDFEPFVSLWM